MSHPHVLDRQLAETIRDAFREGRWFLCRSNANEFSFDNETYCPAVTTADIRDQHLRLTVYQGLDMGHQPMAVELAFPIDQTDVWESCRLDGSVQLYRFNFVQPGLVHRGHLHERNVAIVSEQYGIDLRQERRERLKVLAQVLQAHGVPYKLREDMLSVQLPDGHYINMTGHDSYRSPFAL